MCNVQLASPATANGTPMPSEHDSDSGMSLAKPGSSAEAKERAEAHEACFSPYVT